MRVWAPTHESLTADVQLRLAGRYIAECGGRGDCLFHVMSFLGCGRPDRHKQLRAAAAAFYLDPAHAQHAVVRALAEEIELSDVDGVTFHSVREYSEHIARAGVMGSVRYELPILAELLCLEVSVVLMEQVAAGSAHADMLRDHVVQPPCSERRVSLLYINKVTHWYSQHAEQTRCS
jgi:hypothetical protein